MFVLGAGGPHLAELGRGIALMRGVVDEVTFARGGSEVRLCKHPAC
jgi:anti-sigma regulatory factor (Ser/Thr protein kinase)